MRTGALGGAHVTRAAFTSEQLGHDGLYRTCVAGWRSKEAIRNNLRVAARGRARSRLTVLGLYFEYRPAGALAIALRGRTGPRRSFLIAS
jgi:hypothetical protein